VWVQCHKRPTINSSMRSSLISASTITENGLLDMFKAVFEWYDFRAREDTGDVASEKALLLNAEDDRSNRRHEEDRSFMATFFERYGAVAKCSRK